VLKFLGMSALRRLGQISLVATLAIATLGAGDLSGRYNDLGHKMMCVCGCNQILIECNHVGCPDSEGMLAELKTSLARGDGDNLILAAFQTKYGPTVLAAPMLTRFNIVAWIVPPAVLLLGLLGTGLLVRKWRLRTVDMPATPTTPGFSQVRDRVRMETDEFSGDPRP
jgi:cytochrome c-type biogenesis protein CcmH/NrfF